MRPTRRPPLLIGFYSDDPAATESADIKSGRDGADDTDHLLDQDSPMLANRHRLPSVPRAWLKSKGLPLRYTSRSRILLAFSVLLTVQITLFMLSEPTWMTIQPAIVLLDDQLLASGQSTVVILDIPSSHQGASSRAKANLQRSRRPRPVKSHLEFLQEDAIYLEAWVATGKVLQGLDFGKYDQIDGLWSWLNGSDPRHQAGLEFFADNNTASSSRPFPGANVDSRFRENDELRYSLRSAKAALGGYLRTSHIVSADYWPSGLPDDLPSGNVSGAPPAGPTAEDERVGRSDVFHVEGGLARHGQVPQWVDLRHPGVRAGDEARVVDRAAPAPALRIHHDWSIYSPLRNVLPETGEAPDLPSPAEAVAWKLGVLPTFNSGAKEASMGFNVTDLSDAFFYSNDDYYLGRTLTTADFSSPLYGPVFLIARYSMVDPVENQEDGLGEYPSYKYTAWLLGQRFGSRKRSYIHHVHKTYIRPLVQESQLMFGDELGRTAAQRFRGEGRTVNHQLLTYNFVMERHREALLWSYFVASADKDGDGVYSDDELDEAFLHLGFASNTSDAVVDVPLPVRDTLLQTTIQQSFGAGHLSLPREATYVFSSQDGYALAELNATRRFDNAWPDYSEGTHSPAGGGGEGPPVATTLDRASCWSLEVERNPVKLFRHVAFARPECGDRLVTLLVARSGRRGLSAFLPHEGALFPEASSPVDRTQTTPHLPLGDRWQDGDFSLAGVARGTGWAGLSRRTFAMLLIQRYAYTIGSAPLKFDMLTTVKSAKETFEKFRKDGGRAAHPFVGINDDISDKEVAETSALFKDWMEEMWPAKQFGLPFERT